MKNLRIGIPSKGRLSEIASDLLKQAGLSFRRQNRSLFAQVKDLPIEITFLRTDDIPVLWQEGAIDMGITGSDIVLESQVGLNSRLQLGTGHCRLALCVPADSGIQDVSELADCRIATTFPNITKDKPYSRAAVGIDDSGQKLWLVIIDGKQPGYSEGMLLDEVAQIFLTFGVEEAIALDGGGSSTLVINPGSGPKLLNTPMHVKWPHQERPIVNHLGFYALPLNPNDGN